jgi:hypothetical protein
MVSLVITVRNKVPSENILVGTFFLTVIIRRIGETYFITYIFNGSLFYQATNS